MNIAPERLQELGVTNADSWCRLGAAAWHEVKANDYSLCTLCGQELLPDYRPPPQVSAESIARQQAMMRKKFKRR